jgi:hypothetical protein
VRRQLVVLADNQPRAELPRMPIPAQIIGHPVSIQPFLASLMTQWNFCHAHTF